jgi:hypothetical protein
MGDGSTRTIENIRVGDMVLATEPVSGESAPRRVTHLIVTEDDKRFNELTIATPNGSEKLTATHEHPFWSPSEGRWLDAVRLTPGMTLRSSDGSTVRVEANRPFGGHVRTFNFTVEELHTYYVLAGVTPVLVHNSTCIRLHADLSAAVAANPLMESLMKHGKLPSNYVTKAQAEAAGWEPGKALGNHLPGAQIGGDVYRNENNLLPDAPGRIWYEADIGVTNAMKRSKQPGTRLLFSSDGLAFVTSDHYKTKYPLPNWK